MTQRGLLGDYPSHPEIEDKLGCNPARFLDIEIRKDGCTKDLTAKALIRGIEDIETIRAWIEVEVALERGHNDGPRQRVITWLNRRQAQLEDDADAPSTVTADNGTPPSATVEVPSTVDSEPASDDDPTEPTSAAGETTPDTAATVATDGGAPSSPPICPDCRGELTREEIGDEVAHWCSYEGQFKEPEGRA